MTKPLIAAAALLTIACEQAPAPTAEPKPPAAAAPAPTAAPAFTGGGYDGPTAMLPFAADRSRAAREASRRAREAALLPDDEEFELRRCTADRGLCAQVVQEGERWHLDIIERAGGAERRFRFTPAAQDTRYSRAWYHLWPSLIRERGGAVMIGLLSVRRAGGGGYGAITTRLSLLRLAPGSQRAEEVLKVPIDGGATQRTCYSEGDMRRRLEECTDDYEFDGRLELDEAADGPPRFRFATRARTYPGRAFRLTEEEQAARDRRQFSRSDLVWVQDPECSYRRTFTFDRHAGRYAPDRPLPECSDYLVAEDDPAD